MEFAIDLATNYGRDARITDLLKRVRVIVMPLTNADGFNNSRSAPINPDPEEGTGTVWTLTGLAPTPGRVPTAARTATTRSLPSCRASSSSA